MEIKSTNSEDNQRKMKTVKIVLEAFTDKPEKATHGSAGYDAKLPHSVELQYGRQIVPLGFSVELPDNMRMDSRPRSGYSSKGLLVLDENYQEKRINADVVLGLVDSDYRGEVGAIINVKDWRLHPWVKFITRKRYILSAGQKIAQMVFTEVPDIAFVETDVLSDTMRGEKGYGRADNE